MEPEKIRTLLATPPEGLEKAAKKLELPLPVAKDIRVQAMNLVLGRCVLCQKPTLVGMCANCRKTAPQRRRIPWPGIGLLKMLKPSDQLLKQICGECGRSFMLSASYLLKRLLSKQLEGTKNTCNRCVKKAEELKKRLEIQKRREAQQKKLEEQKKAKDREMSRGRELTYQPFRGNKGLEQLRSKLRTSQSRRKHRRSPKKG